MYDAIQSISRLQDDVNSKTDIEADAWNWLKVAPYCFLKSKKKSQFQPIYFANEFGCPQLFLAFKHFFQFK